METTWKPGPYTLSRLGHDVTLHVPVLLRSGPALAAGFAGPERLPLQARLALQLRFARRMGCPVCLALMPGLARRVGLTDHGIEAALKGDVTGVPAEAGAVIAWADAVLDAGGAKPDAVPPGAEALSEARREHLVAWTRLDLVIHSTGLMFLPHSMIERALTG